MRYPRELDLWRYAPGRSLAHVAVQTTSAGQCMANLGKSLSKIHANVISASMLPAGTAGEVSWSLFLDITGTGQTVKAMRERFLALPGVTAVSVAASEDGLVVHSQRFPLQLGGRRAVIIKADALNDMLDRLTEVFGSGAAVIVDQMGEAMGRSAARYVLKELGKKFSSDHLEALIGTYGSLGYAAVELEPGKSVDLHVVLHAKELFECEANAGRRVRRRSVFFRAHVRGFVTGVLGLEAEVEEVQCIAEGADECAFRIALKEDAVASVLVEAVSRRRDSQSTF